MKREIFEIIKKCKGRVTAGDIVSSLALSRASAEEELKNIAKDLRCFLEVTEEGELIYNFGETLSLRLSLKDRASFFLRKFLFSFRDTIIFLFKIWIMVMLFLYFIVYFFILLFLIGGSGGRVRIDLRPMVELLKSFIKKIAVASKKRKDGVEYLSLKDKSIWEIPVEFKYEEIKPPVYQKIFHFVFGSPPPLLGEKERDVMIINYLLLHKGIIAPSEIAALFGMSIQRAKEEMSRIFVKYEGEFEVSDEGVIIYSFPSVMKRVSKGENPLKKEELLCSFQKMEIEYLKNKKKEKWIPFINGFNLCFALFMNFYLLNYFGMEGKWSHFIFVSFPLTFSILFFFFPLIRSFYSLLISQKKKRNFIYYAFQKLLWTERKNIEKNKLFENLKKISPLPIDKKVLKNYEDNLILSHNGDIECKDDGKIFYNFNELFLELETVKEKRKKIREDSWAIGEISYSTSENAN